MNNDYDDMFEAAGQHFNIDPSLLKTVFHNESGGNVNAPRGAAGEIGAFQFMPATAKRLGMVNPQDMGEAVPAAARLLREGLDKSGGNPAGALAYYNSGRVNNYPASTAQYINRAIQAYPQMAVKGSGKQKQSTPDYEALGEQVVTGKSSDSSDAGSTSSKSNSDDPYLAMGEEVVKGSNKQAAAPPQPAPAQPTSPQPVAQEQQAPAPQQNLVPQAQPNQMTAAPVADRTPTVDPTGNPLAQKIRDYLSEQPGDYHFQGLGAFLPISHNDNTGKTRLDIPQAIKNLGTGVLDLIEGPQTGTVTPEGSMSLANMLMGGRLGSSPASKASAGIPLDAKSKSALAGAKEAADNEVLSPEFRANSGASPGLGQAFAPGPRSANPNIWDTKIADKKLPDDIQAPENQRIVDQITQAVKGLTQNPHVDGFMKGSAIGHMVGVPGLGVAMAALGNPAINNLLGKIPGNLKKEIMKQVINRMMPPHSTLPAYTGGGATNPFMAQPDYKEEQ